MLVWFTSLLQVCSAVAAVLTRLARPMWTMIIQYLLTSFLLGWEKFLFMPYKKLIIVNLSYKMKYVFAFNSSENNVKLCYLS